MFALYPPRRRKSRCGVDRGHRSGTICVVQSRLAWLRCSRIGDFVPLLPLFPLEVVLLPGTPLPLHIFEPRYKEMIGECRANSAPFGVVRALEDGIADIGCTAEIVTVTKEYPDGRLDLIARRPRSDLRCLNSIRSVRSCGLRFCWFRMSQGLRPRRRKPGRFRSTARFCLSLARCRIFPPSIRPRSRFISRDPCRSISTSSRSCSRCDPRASASRWWRPTWKASCPICGARHERARRQEATDTRIDHSGSRRSAKRGGSPCGAYNRGKLVRGGSFHESSAHTG